MSWTEAGRWLLNFYAEDPNLPANVAAIEAEAAAIERARWADFLAREMAYPEDVQFSTPPPVTLDEMAAAWHRHDPSATLEEWRESLADCWHGPAAATTSDTAPTPEYDAPPTEPSEAQRWGAFLSPDYSAD